ncbi:hypothetical protein [Agromyces bauzanensis]
MSEQRRRPWLAIILLAGVPLALLGAILHYVLDIQQPWVMTVLVIGSVLWVALSVSIDVSVRRQVARAAHESRGLRTDFPKLD